MINEFPGTNLAYLRFGFGQVSHFSRILPSCELPVSYDKIYFIAAVFRIKCVFNQKLNDGSVWFFRNQSGYWYARTTILDCTTDNRNMFQKDARVSWQLVWNFGRDNTFRHTALSLLPSRQKNQTKIPALWSKRSVTKLHSSYSLQLKKIRF